MTTAIVLLAQAIMILTPSVHHAKAAMVVQLVLRSATLLAVLAMTLVIVLLVQAIMILKPSVPHAKTAMVVQLVL